MSDSLRLGPGGECRPLRYSLTQPAREGHGSADVRRATAVTGRTTAAGLGKTAAEACATVLKFSPPFPLDKDAPPHGSLER